MRTRHRLLLVVPVALLGGCDWLPPAPSREAEPGLRGQRPSPPRPAAPALATVAEVEVSGRVLPPPDAPPGRLLVALTDGPCFQPGTHYLAWARPEAAGTYLLAVFPPVGTRLEACGAIVEPLRRGLVWWGRADRGTMAVEGRVRTSYHATDIPLRRGPEVPLPVGLAP